VTARTILQRRGCARPGGEKDARAAARDSMSKIGGTAIKKKNKRLQILGKRKKMGKMLSGDKQ